MQVTPCREKDVGKLMSFVDENWRRGDSGHILARDERLLRWQFDPTRAARHEFTGPSVLLAWDHDLIVGMLGLIPFDLNIRDATAPGVWLSQWLISSDRRAGDSGLELLRAAYEMGYEAVFGLGVNATARPIYLLLGFEVLTDMPRWIGVLDIEATIAVLLEAPNESDPAAVRELCLAHAVHLDDVELFGSEVRVLETTAAFGAEWDELWCNTLAPSLLSPSRNAQYLNWRYTRHPTWKYMILVARDSRNDELLGLSVARLEGIKDRSETVFRVLELLATKRAELPLAHSLVTVARERGAIFADFYCAADKVGAALERIGFIKPKAGTGSPTFPARFQPLDSTFQLTGAFWLSEDLRQKVGSLLGPQDFYVTKADSDQDRPL